jgi:hypothetical protein
MPDRPDFAHHLTITPIGFTARVEADAVRTASALRRIDLTGEPIDLRSSVR